MANPIPFRPTKETIVILTELEKQSDFNRSEFVNRTIVAFSYNLDKKKELEREKYLHETTKSFHDFSLKGILEEKRKAQDKFESQIKTANDKIKELQGQLSKCQEDREILKSKNNFLTTETSNLDKTHSKN